jgi:hypothetical protein
MSQFEPQPSPQDRPHNNAGKVWGTPFQPGNNARNAKRQRIAQLMADIAADFEGGLDGMRAADRIILEKAAGLLCQTPKTHWDACRGINAANRLLGGLRKRLKPRPRQARTAPSMAELLERRNANGG